MRGHTQGTHRSEALCCLAEALLRPRTRPPSVTKVETQRDIWEAGDPAQHGGERLGLGVALRREGASVMGGGTEVQWPLLTVGSPRTRLRGTEGPSPERSAQPGGPGWPPSVPGGGRVVLPARHSALRQGCEGVGWTERVRWSWRWERPSGRDTEERQRQRDRHRDRGRQRHRGRTGLHHGSHGAKSRPGQGWSFRRLQRSIGSHLFQLLEVPHPWLAAPPASSQPAAQHLPSLSASDPPASLL